MSKPFTVSANVLDRNRKHQKRGGSKRWTRVEIECPVGCLLPKSDIGINRRALLFRIE
jgi:hypothetical protein